MAFLRLPFQNSFRLAISAIAILIVVLWLLSKLGQTSGTAARELWLGANAPRQNSLEVRVGNGSDKVTLYKIDFTSKKWIGLAEWTEEQNGPPTEAVRIDAAEPVIGGNDGSPLSEKQIQQLQKWLSELPPSSVQPFTQLPHVKIAVRLNRPETAFVYEGKEAEQVIDNLCVILGQPTPK